MRLLVRSPEASELTLTLSGFTFEWKIDVSPRSIPGLTLGELPVLKSAFDDMFADPESDPYAIAFHHDAATIFSSSLSPAFFPSRTDLCSAR